MSLLWLGAAVAMYWQPRGNPQRWPPRYPSPGGWS